MRPLLLMILVITACQPPPGEEKAPPQNPPLPQTQPGDVEPSDPYFDETISRPLVKILAPADDDVVSNPVTITVSCYNIHHFALYDNGVLVKQEVAPLEHTDVEWTMLKSGLPHNLELFGYSIMGEEVAYHRVTVIPLPDLDLTKGDLVGSLWISYYYLSREIDFGVKPEVVLRDAECVPLAVVDYAYMSEVCVEGSGQLLDHAVINYSKSCKCAVPCPYGGGKICYDELDKEKYPWGEGIRSAALIPFRSLAVDSNVIPHNTTIYMEEWDGVYIPPVDGLGNFIHDGCFIAHDVGGWIKNDHFDFFSGTRAMWLALERIVPTRSRFTLYTDAGRCKWLKESIREHRLEASQGAGDRNPLSLIIEGY